MTKTIGKDLNILIVDDEPNIRRVLEVIFLKEGFKVLTAENGRKAIEIANTEHVDVLISDLIMPDLTGVEVLSQIKNIHPSCAAIIVTAYGTIRSAVEATRAGAFDYLQKPFDVDEVRLMVKKALEFSRSPASTRSTKPQLKNSETDILQCKSAAMQAVYRIVERAANSRTTVLIRGESGTGKELIARALHTNGSRSDKPFVAVNCAALPETLIESELFGHEKNAFTGATTARAGRFEMAHTGTLFIDEVGDMPGNVQIKLLRVLQEREIERLGSSKSIKIDVRLVAATNRNLELAMADNKFRDDLYHRLNIIGIDMPPLREREEDIMPLAHHFLSKLVPVNDRCIKSFHPDIEPILLRYSWPGNVRELENVIERGVVLAESDSLVFTPDLLPNSLLKE